MKIEEVTPYLAYELKGIASEGDNNGSIETVLGLQIFNKGTKFEIITDYDNITPDSFKLILRPLSDLTKPCLENGKIPIVELAKMNDKYIQEPLKAYSENWANTCSCETVQFNCDYIVKTGNMGDLVYQFSYWQDLQRFAFRDNTRSRHMAVGYQLQLFQKLFEWHFDVFGLIEKGEAIDINTIQP